MVNEKGFENALFQGYMVGINKRINNLERKLLFTNMLLSIAIIVFTIKTW